MNTASSVDEYFNTSIVIQSVELYKENCNVPIKYDFIYQKTKILKN